MRVFAVMPFSEALTATCFLCESFLYTGWLVLQASSDYLLPWFNKWTLVNMLYKLHWDQNITRLLWAKRLRDQLNLEQFFLVWPLPTVMFYGPYSELATYVSNLSPKVASVFNQRKLQVFRVRLWSCVGQFSELPIQIMQVTCV